MRQKIKMRHSKRHRAGACRKPGEFGRHNNTVPPAYPATLKIVTVVAVALIAIILFIYAPTRKYGFLSYDDPLYVSDNVQVIRGLTRQGFSWAFTTGHASNWHPLTWLSHMLDVQMYGMNAGLHHTTNVLLHLVNALLLFGILFRMTGAWRRSAMVAALFAVHPLHVESVAWIAERKDVLSTVFWLLTMHAYLSYVRKPRLPRYMTVVAVFALGLMSKPMLVTLPFVLLLADVWPLSRVRLEAGQLRVWLRLFREKIPLFLMAVASSIVTVVVQSSGGAVQSFEAAPLDQRAANALLSYVAYLGRMVWPRDLAAFYPYHHISPWCAVASASGLIIASVLVIRSSRLHPYLLVGWFWYVLTLVPVIGLIQVGTQARADRYTYIPLIGIFIVLAWGIPVIFQRWRYRGAALQAAGCVVVCALAAAARSQVRYWGSDLALWEHAVRATTANYFAHTNLGIVLAAAGDLPGGIAQYTEALRSNPNSVETHNALGSALFRQGQPEAAMEQYAIALRIEPGFAEAHSNRGIILAQRGDAEEAFSEFRKALEIDPDNPEIQYNMGFALASEGKLDEAMSRYRKALMIRPNYADAHFQMGNAFAGKGMLSEAATEYTEALRIRPKYADAHNNLGAILLRQNRYNEAITHFTEALRIDPQNGRARRNLNRALAKSPSPTRQ